ncbi:MAG: DUF1064 domain-containing protein [Calditrichaeota bacterium]|nr:DUF1064 domain-containing protein [Calditrichota bacterium]
MGFSEEEAKALVERAAKNRRARSKAADQRAAIAAAQADIPRASGGRGHYPEREPGRGHKYGARATVVDGIRFPSIAEAEYYKLSKIRQSAGEIDYFLLWPCFVLPGGVRVRFDQQIIAAGKVEYVDVKGKITAQFKRNKKLVEELWPIKVKVVIFKAGRFQEVNL